jgi:peroxiredoxin
MTQALHTHLQPGDPAPDFTLPAVVGDRAVSLSDYRGRSPLLLGLFPGFFCPFCRRAIAQMSASAEKLKPLGIESLAVVATDLENARLYYRFRPTKVSLLADPQRTTHRSYGVPQLEPTPELMEAVASVRINPTGELPEPMSIDEAVTALTKIDGYRLTPTDEREAEQQFAQLKGQFLIDRDGLIRWANLECGREGVAGVGKFPTHDELLEAAQLHAVR